jgi:hypothetical protein
MKIEEMMWLESKSIIRQGVNFALRDMYRETPIKESVAMSVRLPGDPPKYDPKKQREIAEQRASMMRAAEEFLAKLNAGEINGA